MHPQASAGQLEFFDLANAPTRRPPRYHSIGSLALRLRHDQLIVAAIGGLISLTVVFAAGVERGKALVRSEQHALVVKERQALPPPAPAVAPGKTQAPSQPPSQPASAPALQKAKAAPAKLAATSSSFAVQVLTAKQLPRAKAELSRLQSRGEKAFLVMREGQTRVFVGPFPSKANALEKVTQLKPRYEDCFVRTL